MLPIKQFNPVVNQTPKRGLQNRACLKMAKQFKHFIKNQIPRL